MIRGGAAIFWAGFIFYHFLHCKVVFCTTLSYNLELVLYFEKLYFEMLYFETGRILI